MSAAKYAVTNFTTFEQICGEIMASDNNMDAAKEGYAKFLSMLKVGTIITALVTILVVFLIS